MGILKSLYILLSNFSFLILIKKNIWTRTLRSPLRENKTKNSISFWGKHEWPVSLSERSLDSMWPWRRRLCGLPSDLHYAAGKKTQKPYFENVYASVILLWETVKFMPVIKESSLCFLSPQPRAEMCTVTHLSMLLMRTSRLWHEEQVMLLIQREFLTLCKYVPNILLMFVISTKSEDSGKSSEQ